MKVLLRSPFSQLSGYGRDGIGIALALIERGHEVTISPGNIDVPLPREIALLLTQEISGIYDLAIYHVPPETVELLPSDAAMARHNVLWTMWGWGSLPDEPWVPVFAERTRLFDQIVVYDPDSAATLGSLISPDRLVTVLGGYTAADWNTLPPVPNRPVVHPYTFGMNGRLSARKGVYTTLEAFHLLREEHPTANVALHLRTTDPILPPEFPLPSRVTVTVARSLPPALRDWYTSIDTLVCPSWAEAKHLPPIEALTCGTPVILSDIAGHRTWATEQMVTWLPTETKVVFPGLTGGYVSPEDLAAAMWAHYLDPGRTRMKALAAARTLPSMLDWTKCLERFGLAVGTRL